MTAQNCRSAACSKFATGFAVACSGLEYLQWHQEMLQHWPPEFCRVYSLAMLVTASQWLQCLQLASASPITTMLQLCQTMSNTVQLTQLASDVHQRGVQMLQAGEVIVLSF